VSLQQHAVNRLRIVTGTYAWLAVGVYRGFLGPLKRVRGMNTATQNGIAHFLSIWRFNRPGQAHNIAANRRAIEDVGGISTPIPRRRSDGVTSVRVLETTCRSGYVIADILRNRALITVEIEVERGVNLQRRSQALRHAGDVIFRLVLQEKGPIQPPIGRTILGPSEAACRTSTREDPVRLYRRSTTVPTR